MATSKIAKLLLSLLLFISYCSGDSINTYHVNSSSDLEQYLCNTTWSSQYLVFLLNSSVNFTISSGNFCQVTARTIEIRSNSSTELAAITCAHHDIPEILLLKKRGFVFFDSKVTLVRLVFKNCGTYLITIQDSLITHYLNGSSLHYNSSHAATLVFVHCQVNITQVNIYSSYGFAMIGVNLLASVLSFMNVSNSTGNTVIAGNGLILHFMDNDDMVDLSNDISYNVSFLHCDFSHNGHFNKLECPLIDHYMYSKYVIHPIINAAGLTILYTQTHFKSHVQVNDAKFKRNLGTVAGAMLILHYINDTGVTGSTIIENATFTKNINLGSCHGAGLAFYWYDKSHDNTVQQPLAIRDSVFSHNSRMFGDNGSPIYVSGVVYIMIFGNPTTDIEIVFEKSSFNDNAVSNWNEETGVCVLAERLKSSGKVQITLKDIHAKQNHFAFHYEYLIASVGIFSFYGISTVNVTGSAARKSMFINNFGSVIHAVDSNIHLHGHILFLNNEARNGAAIKSTGHSQVYFEDEVVAKFINNIAYHSGGALYLYKDTLPSEIKQSVIHVRNHFNVTFSGNKAGCSGNSIYAYPLYGHRATVDDWINAFQFIDLPNNSLLPVSTKPSKLNMCTGSHSYFSSYPGLINHINMAAIDKLNHHVWSPVYISIILQDTSGYNNTNTKVWLGKQDNPILKEGQNCTSVNITVFVKCHNFINGFIKAVLVLSLPDYSDFRVIQVTINPCPLGFQLDNSTGKCTCNKALNYLAVYYDSLKFHCNIQDRTITPSHGRPWIGKVKFERVTKFGASKVCPLRYCQFEKSNQAFQIDKLNSKTLISSNGSTVPLCMYNREDVLCGRCPSNLSVVFGSEECKRCHPGYIALTVSIFLVAGPLLIYLLFALRLTLTTGTFNGIIFYAQAANVGILDMLNVCNGKMGVVRKISIVFLSVLNLGLGFPLCFYNGMTELWKAGLSLLFSLYLLTIVVVLIILSHFSLRLSNKIADSSVQVLVTVVHLSFGKLLGSIINVYTPAIVFTSEQTYHVWYWDGSVEYGSKGHIILMVITSLVVFSLLLPYILLLLFVKPLRLCRCANEYTRPILEAIHAPYKDGKQYWFVARLLLLIMMYILYSIEPYAQVIYIAIASVLVLFIIGQAMFRPYKSNFINLLDSWLLFNLAFVYSTIWYQGHIEVTVYSKVAILLFFITFFIILVYHILFITGQLKKIERKAADINTRVSQYFLRFNHKYQYHGNQRSRRLPLQDTNSSFYEACDNFREPMLSSSK